ncbi:hypothetical protein KS4_16110 [Poriferisphaera corsica]|uniref:Uncharacterized protein n=1 Tax=Poriferisphaera corsica TaxID=2528020 RepID=A0A517YTJ4_9BACT|nr:hypothetical protein [Poriferisphaera corsica]QDU33560.1 hypothetical protein KS4_16110 [Poriferisphaera corsica]
MAEATTPAETAGGAKDWLGSLGSSFGSMIGGAFTPETGQNIANTLLSQLNKNQSYDAQNRANDIPQIAGQGGYVRPTIASSVNPMYLYIGGGALLLVVLILGFARR